MSVLRILSFLIFASLLTLTISCQKKGCTDSNATNFDPNAEKDDGSCKLALVAHAIIRVESVCADFSTQTEHEVSCAVYDEVISYVNANVGNPCMYYTFTNLNGDSVSGYIRSTVGC